MSNVESIQNTDPISRIPNLAAFIAGGAAGIAGVAGIEYVSYHHREATNLTDTSLAVGGAKMDMYKDADPTDFYLQAPTTTVERTSENAFKVTVVVPNEQAGDHKQAEHDRTQHAIDMLVSGVADSGASIDYVNVTANASDLTTTEGNDSEHPYGLGVANLSQKKVALQRGYQAKGMLQEAAKEEGLALSDRTIKVTGKELVVSKEGVEGIGDVARQIGEWDSISHTVGRYVKAYKNYPDSGSANRPKIHEAAPELKDGNNLTITVGLERKPTEFDHLAYDGLATHGGAFAIGCLAAVAVYAGVKRKLTRRAAR